MLARGLLVAAERSHPVVCCLGVRERHHAERIAGLTSLSVGHVLVECGLQARAVGRGINLGVDRRVTSSAARRCPRGVGGWGGRAVWPVDNSADQSEHDERGEPRVVAASELQHGASCG